MKCNYTFAMCMFSPHATYQPIPIFQRRAMFSVSVFMDSSTSTCSNHVIIVSEAFRSIFFLFHSCLGLFSLAVFSQTFSIAAVSAFHLLLSVTSYFFCIVVLYLEISLQILSSLWPFHWILSHNLMQTSINKTLMVFGIAVLHGTNTLCSF